MAVNALTRLVEHCVWANAKWMDYLVEAFPEDEFTWVRMTHVLLGEHAWFERVLGRQPDRNIWRVVPIEQLRELHAKNDAFYHELLRGNLDRVIAYKRFSGEEYQSPISDILLHLTLHGAHHRGQIATHVSTQGRQPINTDFIQYCLVHSL